MGKRRRLANKMTIMVCAVLIAVSAFFYAPMEVSAEESINVSSVQTLSVDEVMTAEVASEVGTSASEDLVLSSGYFERINLTTDSFVMATGLNSDLVYKVDLTIDSLITPSVTGSGASLRAYAVIWNNVYNFVNANALGLDEVRSSTVSRTVYLSGDVLMSERYFTIRGVVTNSRATTLTLDFDYSITIDSISEVSNTNSVEYQNGYNAGYSAGESVGYGNGYSQGFTDGEASVDTDAIYDEAYQAGIDSVDTQSYYDAGYQAGYQVAYSEGYESGYDVGYQSAMDRINSWGADTSDYPKQMYSIDMGHTFSTNVTYSVPFSYSDSVKGSLSNVNLNPNHTYKFDVEIRPHNWDSADTITYEDEFYFCIGGIDYPLSYLSSGSCLTSLFVPGDRMSNSFYLVWSTIRASVDGTNNICRVVCPYTITLYDMGPSGDTQNHIANQTDQLTNGYDDSKGNTVNSDLSTGLNDFETAENSLFVTATTGMKDFTFFDFESVPAMIIGMSFIGSIMGSWFNQAGGASGVGIVLSILFSVILVAMVLGLYRWYQSRGGKN